MAILDILESRYGWTASDTQVIQTYIVITDGDSNGFEVCRPSYDDKYTPETPKSVTLPKIFDYLQTSGGDSTTFRVLPGGITANRVDGKIDQWMVNVAYTQTSMLVDRISSFSLGSKSYTKVSEGAYFFLAPGEPAIGGWDDDDEDDSFPPTKPIINSAGELYDPGDTMTEYTSTIISFIMREADEFDYVDILALRGSINKNAVQVLGFDFKKHAGRILDIVPQINIDEDGKPRWFSKYTLELMPNGLTHDLRLQDQGWMAKFDGKDNPAREIMVSDISSKVKKSDKTNKPVTQQQLLNKDGGIETDPDKAQHWDYRIHRQSDWKTKFNFPTTSVDVAGDGKEFKEGQL